MGAVGQFRALGGSVGLAVCAVALNNHFMHELSTELVPGQLAALARSVDTVKLFPPSLHEPIRHAYSGGFREQMQAMAAFSGAAVLASLLAVEKKPRRQTVSDSMVPELLGTSPIERHYTENKPRHGKVVGG